MATISEKIKALQEKRDQVNNKIKELERRNKSNERKKDTRRKIIAGSILLKYFENTGQTQLLKKILSKGLESDEDRALFNLKEETHENSQ